MKRFFLYFSIILITVLTTISLINFGDAGSDNEVAIQGSIGIFTSADLHPDLGGNSHTVQYITPQEYDGTNVSVKKDVISLNKNTFSLPDYYALGNELFEVPDVNYDGNSMWVRVRLANVRSGESTDNDIVTQIAQGLEVLRISYTDEWSYIRLDDGTEGYVMSSLLSSEFVEEREEETEPEVPVQEVVPDTTVTETAPEIVPETTQETIPETTATTATNTINENPYSAIKYTTCDLNVRSGPGVGYDLVNVLSYGQQVTIEAITDNGWYRLSDGNYIKTDYCTDQAPVIVTPEVTAPEETESNGYSDFANYALQFVGTPYVFAGSSPSGFDCSGFVLYLYANYYGISLPHNAAEISVMGSSVSGDGIQCGDVLCHDYNGDGYIDHVSLYIGNGTCIHASDSRRGVITSSYPMGSIVTIRRFV